MTAVERRTPYGLGVTVPLAYDTAVERTREALAAQGFGVITEIDVQGTLDRKLGVAFRPYVILGACNPTLAHQALEAERDIGLLLPCNVIVYAGDAPGSSVVAALDPVAQLSISGRRDLEPLAHEVRRRLEAALESVSEGAAAAPR